MKKLFILALVLIPQLCFADMYVLLDKQTKEVLSASEKNDTVPAEGQEIAKVKGSLADFIDDNPVNYKYTGNKFVRNIKKISERAQAEESEKERIQEEKLIESEIRAQAIKALKEKGAELKHITE
jgi:tRNA C32,U32 (ribose-2'-O)-methylase TrmJ